MSKLQEKAHAGSIADYLRSNEGRTWSPAETRHVLEHIRQVEAAWERVLYEAQQARAGQ